MQSHAIGMQVKKKGLQKKSKTLLRFFRKPAALQQRTPNPNKGNPGNDGNRNPKFPIPDDGGQMTGMTVGHGPGAALPEADFLF
jgi:hypothetical protein